MITSPTLEREEPDVLAHLEEIQKFCRRHGEDPAHVAGIELLPGGRLRFTVYRERDGHRYLACVPADATGWDHVDHEGPCVPASEQREHGLVGELPEWWQPAQ